MTERSGIYKFFEHNWEKIVLWAILVGTFYLLKPFLLLSFQTFLITYMTKSAVEWLVGRFKLNYRLTTVLVFMLFVGLLGATGAWIGPKLIVESNNLLAQFAGDGELQTREKINRFVENIVVKAIGEAKAQAVIDSDGYATVMKATEAEVTKAATAALPHILLTLLHVLRLGWEVLIALVLAVVFSFILVMDWRNISAGVRVLERSRIATFFHAVAPHLRAFAEVLGKALRAQAIIATCNTVLTGAGLWFLGVPNIAILSTLVFLCGFIPILGAFLSALPILLFGIQAGGLSLVLKLVVLITLVHAVEAYILNPRITGAVLHVHPILVLVLLLLGERFFGVWGMVLGVPIGCYVISVLTKTEPDLQEVQRELPP